MKYAKIGANQTYIYIHSINTNLWINEWGSVCDLHGCLWFAGSKKIEKHTSVLFYSPVNSTCGLEWHQHQSW